MAVTIVDNVLRQNLADALRDAALHLTVYDRWIDDHTNVVDGDVAIDSNRTGLGIDLDFADMAAVRKVEFVGVEVTG